MSIFKCKMCGGSLEVAANQTTAVCEYCGTKQTLPRLDDDRRAQMYDRANHFRRNNEFDKAMGIYEKILNEDSTDAEAYWSLVLCRYGIEYVEDPATHKRVPTVNRAQFTSVFDDEDYKSAIQYADSYQKSIYEEEANTINEIQKGILAISQKEEPFDVFICYKETDSNGKRTPDSVLATDLYHQLTQEGFKVFFSRITLEDKLGEEYEPYIFAALNSAKVMVVIGTKPEYFNAVWVKNEWSRYLALIKNGAKKILIPAYRDMDPYDLPEEFSHLQAQDMSKLGFMQDLIRGIKKLAENNEPKTVVKETVTVNSGGANIAPLLKRAFMFLEDGDFARADDFCEQVLNQEPENAEAYLGKLMAELKVRRKEELADCAKPFDNSGNYQKAVRFADDNFKKELTGFIAHINERNENQRLSDIYNNAVSLMETAKSEKDFIYAAEVLQTIPGFKDADELKQKCKLNIEDIIKEQKRQAEEKRIADEKRKKRIKKTAIISTPIVAIAIAFLIILNTVVIPSRRYNNAVELMNSGKYKEAIAEFQKASSYRDAKEILRTLLANPNTEYLSAGTDSTFAIKSDGTVVSAGDNIYGQYNLSDWTDMAAISTGKSHTVGLKSDGSVMAVGYNDDGQCDVQDWTDITEISAGYYHTVGLKSNGTVEVAGNNSNGRCDVKSWKSIVAISAGGSHTVGLKSDGTVVATKYTGKYYEGQCEVESWTDIVAISAGHYHTVGLKLDGTVLAVGNNYDGQCDVQDWENIIAISAGENYTVGLKADGTVVAVGNNNSGQCDVESWTDIVAISAGYEHTVGLKADGTVVAVGSNSYGQCDVQSWKDIKVTEK